MKSATAKKKVGWLAAAVNLAIDDRKMTFNPFVRVVRKLKDEEQRLPLDDSDMTLLYERLSDLTYPDQLLVRLLASTGMRLGEAFEINGEHLKVGIRTVLIGTKTKQSRRFVPLPERLFEKLPRRISGPLFEGTAAAASKRLNKHIAQCGINDSRKVVHSLRHRAKDRLRALSCPEDIQDQILGHNKKTVSAGYGVGYPMETLKGYIDQI